MKTKFLYLLIIVFSVSLISCKKRKAEKGLIGAWDVSSKEGSGIFYLDKKGLHTIKHINMYDALLGGKGEVKLFDKTITYTIPKCVKNGTMLRIKNKGFPSYNNPDMLGDFYVNILVDLPSELNSEQESLIKQMKDLENGL